MPAYRSAAEAEIRTAVVQHLRILIPGCRIIHEINASSFGNRIDVLAVGRDRIAAVEIKSKRDKLDRLKDQITAMDGVTHEVYAALHERFLKPFGPAGKYGFLPPDEAGSTTVWAYPLADRDGHIDIRGAWRASRHDKMTLPDGAINILWREELQAICSGLGVPRFSRLTMSEAIDHIKYRMTGAEIKDRICRILRNRSCPEADAPIRDA